MTVDPMTPGQVDPASAHRRPLDAEIEGQELPGWTLGPDSRSGPGSAATPYDPLRLCIYATIAGLAWLFGPLAVLGFAGLGLAGYVRARSRGLTKSKCVLRDTRLVLAYLALLAAGGAAGIAFAVARWFS